MVEAAYITLDGYQYKVIAEAHEPGQSSPGELRYTISGKTDRTESGIVQWEWRYRLLVPWTGSGGYGGLAQLRASFAKRTPSTNQLSLTDNYGDIYTVYFTEKGPERNLTPRLTDATSKYIVEVRLVKVI